MIKILAEKICDNRFLRLMRNMLRAGYLEDWRWNATLSTARHKAAYVQLNIIRPMRSAGLCAVPAWRAWWGPVRRASAAHNADDPIMRPGRGRAAHDRRSAGWSLCLRWCPAWTRSWCVWAIRTRRWPGTGAAGAAWRGTSLPRRGRVLPGRGDGVGRRSLWLLREGAGRHAQADRCVLVQGRPDAGRVRGPRGCAAPLLPHGQQADRGRGRCRCPVRGVAAGRWPQRLDRAGLRDTGRGVHRVRGHPRRDSPLRCRDTWRRSSPRWPAIRSRLRAEAVRGAVVSAVRRRRRPG